MNKTLTLPTHPTTNDKVVFIERFQLLKPNYENQQTLRTQPLNPDIELTTITDDVYYNFPVILDNRGEPWDIANLCLINRLNNTLSYNHRTYGSQANHLLHYRRFLDSENINYLHFPKLKQLRATYRYKRHIQNEIDKGHLTLGTGKKIMSAVARFYKDIIKYNLIDRSLFTESPYSEVVRYIEATTYYGLKKFIAVPSTDLSISGSKPLPDPSYIYDGGQAKPLTLEDQKTLLDALRRCDRVYQLLFYLAIFTGARLQTLTTIRISHLERVPDYHGNLRLPIGTGTGIDTKNGSRMTIIIPAWLVEDLKVYSNSTVAINRRLNSYYGDNDNNYLFLSARGTSFYTSKAEMKERLTADPSDPYFSELYKHTEGQAVREFIKSLNQSIQNDSPEFQSLIFHDLRATFGMNLLEEELAKEKRGTITAILEYVQQRMGHRSKEITLQYLNYRSRLDWKNHVQNKFESELFKYVVRSVAQ